MKASRKAAQPPPVFDHLREAYPQGAPKYDNKKFEYGFQIFIVGFGGLRSVPAGQMGGGLTHTAIVRAALSAGEQIECRI